KHFDDAVAKFLQVLLERHFLEDIGLIGDLREPGNAEFGKFMYRKILKCARHDVIPSPDNRSRNGSRSVSVEFRGARLDRVSSRRKGRPGWIHGSSAPGMTGQMPQRSFARKASVRVATGHPAHRQDST